ncbi:hypothetical protein LJC41_06770 [Desulfosarcina sp. OttesenSCG-928-G17]|nr:hypothetical protein [Desulfosarcina sp. OttesenSCG-928-G17]
MNSEKFVEKVWHDETAGKSKIERLEFPADHYWTRCEIDCKGENHKEQHFEVSVFISGDIRVGGDSFNLKNNEIRRVTVPINEKTEVSVRGFISTVALLQGAGGRVTARLYYND